MDPRALGFALLVMLCWGSAPLLDKIGMREVGPLAGLTIRVVAAATMVALYGLFSGVWREVLQAPRVAVLSLIGSAVLGAALGQAAYYAALRYGEASRVTPVVAAFPLVTVLLAIVLLGESLTWTKVAGAALVIGGVLLVKS